MKSNRIIALDIARALAIVGMVMIHVAPQADTVLRELFFLPHGRASVLFVTLAGCGAALLARAIGPGAAGIRLVLYGMILLPIGLTLQSLPHHGVLVILSTYAAYFLVAAIFIRCETSTLALTATAWLILGPMCVLFLGSQYPDLTPRPEIDWFLSPSDNALNIFLIGGYPVLSWGAPLLWGIWTGRQLDTPKGSVRIARAGVLLVFLAGAVVLLGQFAPGEYGELLPALFDHTPHSETPGWMMSATGTAMITIAILLRMPNLPGAQALAALGRVSLSLYVGHILLLSIARPFVGRIDPLEAMLLLVVIVWSGIASGLHCQRLQIRGPLETFLHMTAGKVTKTINFHSP